MHGPEFFDRETRRVLLQQVLGVDTWEEAEVLLGNAAIKKAIRPIRGLGRKVLSKRRRQWDRVQRLVQTCEQCADQNPLLSRFPFELESFLNEDPNDFVCAKHKIA